MPRVSTRLLSPDDRPHPPADLKLTPELVINALLPVISPQKARRIEQVVLQRLVSVTVVLEDLYDPHNGAAVLRSCEALGLMHVHVVQNKETFSFSRRVTHNAHKWVSVYKYDTIDDCLGTLHGWGFASWAAAPPALEERCIHPPSIDVRRPTALVFGNEHAGLSPRARELCQRCFSIPMYGFTESLNLSVCAAVALHQVTTDRRRLLGAPGDLPPEERQRLKAGYYAQSTRHAADVVWQALQTGNKE